jgi:hypothetical protein
MSRRQLLRSMDAAEFLDWQAYWSIEPFGDEWRQSGQIAASTLNAGGVRNGSKGFAADDIIGWNIPGWSEERQQENLERDLGRLFGPPQSSE